ncbi:MAG: class I SAM-dependent methyltransferase [Acidimicrobiales bacterium]
MADRERVDRVRHSYDAPARRYLDHVGGEMHHASLERSALQLFADLAGPDALTIDAGCGPGHITSFLADRGLQKICGIDLSPEMIALAQASFPAIDFRVGELAMLPVADGGVDAVVSRHSIIHTEPPQLEAVFTEFARVLVPGGLLFVSFFAVSESSEHGEPFDHAVCTAYQLDPSTVAGMLSAVGIVEEMRLLRRPTTRERQIPHATLIARRVST